MVSISVRHDGALALVILSALAKICIDYFMFFISPEFGVYGVVVSGSFYSFEYWRSWVLFFVVTSLQIIYIRGRGDIFDCALSFIFYAIFFPVLSYSWVSSGNSDYLYFCALFWFSLFFILTFLPVGERGRHVGEASRMEGGLSWTYLFLVCLLGVLMLMKFGLALDLGFDSVYERRKAFGDWRGGGPIAYLYSWSVYVFAAFLIFVSRPVVFRAAGFVYLVYFFGVAGDKVYLFLLGVVFFLRFSSLRGGVALILCFLIALNAFGVMMYSILGDVWAAAVVNRFLVLPVDISFKYVSFFGNDLLLYSYSFLSSFFDYSFSDLPAFLIGSQFYVVGDNANVNFLTDAYVNFGWLSVLPLLLFFLLLRVLLSDTRYLVIIVPLLVQALNTPLPTLLLTGGGGVMVISCYILNRYTPALYGGLKGHGLVSR
ncbi:hypothetical protein ACS8MQ_22505 [Pseudomonas sp. MAHUQ-62]|uniref:hypothetical protein n=1 Tax=Pseudomonas sp. GCM10023245 TaxID=3252652 RepID=UPI0036088117